MSTSTALIIRARYLDTLYDADLLCNVCEQRPWSQIARFCDARICASCAEGEPEPDNAPVPTQTHDERMDALMRTLDSPDAWMAWVQDYNTPRTEDVDDEPYTTGHPLCPKE